ncbi:helix-turn-helix domain-containing protein [Yinghuangia aomiensis]
MIRNSRVRVSSRCGRPHRNSATSLKSRRARLRPEDVGIRDYGGFRRVAGLRREELARLAGVSIAHYTRLEQGKGGSVSPEVLNAIGNALRLAPDELAHLHRLAHPRHRPGPGPGRPEVRPGLHHLIASFTLTPALLTGRHTQVLAWNPLAAALFGDFAEVPEEQRSITHLMFVIPGMCALHGERWEQVAREHVGHLRFLAGRRPEDAGFAEHIDELRAASRVFDRMWAEHPVAQVRNRVHHLDHPRVGRLVLFGELLPSPTTPI